MAPGIAARLGRLERALAALPPCPACAGGPRFFAVAGDGVEPREACDVCGRELEPVLVADPYAERNGAA